MQCKGPECEKSARAAGLCDGHYRQRRSGKELTVIRRRRNDVPEDHQCTFEGCRRPLASAVLCDAHYRQMKRGDRLSPIRPRDGRYWKDQSGYLARHESWTDADTGKRVQRKVLQHREVMEGVLGRPLLDTETVHHRNAVRDDNRPENLELWSTFQPKGGRVVDLVEWAHQLIELYPDVEKVS